MVTPERNRRVRWVVLVYRVPRTPSTPRIAIWRRLRALGVAALGDGVVALPEDARTLEHLEWVADQILEAGGTALLLRAETVSGDDERAIAESMAIARAEEYRAVAEAAAEAVDGPVAKRHRALARLRKETRGVRRRDYFPPAERDRAAAAISQLANSIQDDATIPSGASGGRRQ